MFYFIQNFSETTMQITSHTMSIWWNAVTESSLWYSHTHIPKGYIEDWAKTWKITCFKHTHNTHFKWQRVIRTLDVFVKNTKKMSFWLWLQLDITPGNSLFWHEVYEALYDLVASMFMLTVKQKLCSKNKQIMRLGQKRLWD